MLHKIFSLKLMFLGKYIIQSGIILCLNHLVFRTINEETKQQENIQPK